MSSPKRYDYILTPEQRNVLEAKRLNRDAVRAKAAGAFVMGTALLGIADGPGGVEPTDGIIPALFGNYYYKRGYEHSLETEADPTTPEESPVRNLVLGLAAFGLALGAAVGAILAATAVISLGSIALGAVAGAGIGLIGIPLVMMFNIMASKVSYDAGRADGHVDMRETLHPEYYQRAPVQAQSQAPAQAQVPARSWAQTVGASGVSASPQRGG